MQATFTPIIVTHMVAALAALALGSYVFLTPKGTVAHRLAGRVWAVLMLITAISTWWIRSSGSFSWIHILSVITVVVLAAAIRFAIQGNIARHQRLMKGLFNGGLVIAGVFTLLPQRLLGHAVWTTLGVM
jgi:uncharacterized membrane protein